MKKLSSILTLTVMAVMLSSCITLSVPICDLEQQGATKVADGFSNLFQCSDRTGVYDDFYAAVQTLHACPVSTKPTGPVGDALCAPLVAFAVDGAANQVNFLKKHGCTAVSAKATAKASLTALCTSVVPMSHQHPPN